VLSLLIWCKTYAEDVNERLLQRGTHDPSLPKPGELVHFDYRNPETAEAAAYLDIDRPLRVVQWNIERGYELDAIKSTLAALDADILILQEIDIGCDRSDNRDTGTATCYTHKIPWCHAFVCCLGYV
jgi:hypothetical protein